MKFKKFLIIILSVALLSCFAVSTFATSATIPDYGFYISPGDYVFDDFVDFSMLSSANYIISMSFFSDVRTWDQMNIFINSNGVDMAFYYQDSQFTAEIFYGLKSDFTWSNDSYRYITVLDGFYIYDIDVYQWWLSNVTRVDSGYDNNLLDGILSSFTFIGEWIAGAANAVTPMFWDGEALTVVGTLAVAGLSFAVVFLLIALVSSFMKFRS